ncbi:MAG: glycoside hydrolase family 2 TIM barrel-domain containing protein [Pseudomonadota bacterium]
MTSWIYQRNLGQYILAGVLAFFIPGNSAVANIEPTSTAIPVTIEETETGWQLLRDGKPYFVQGAGGDGDISKLAAIGANSLRTWGADDIGPTLDAAHAAGLSVTVGIWLGHERHGFDYNNEAQVAAQLDYVREKVLEYRDHPALLIWALGNEMEGFEQGDNPKIWAAVNDAAKLVKSLDPHHPTMTVTAEIGGERVRYVHEVCDAIDIHGINSYGGAPSLPERLEAAGATKPYILTEFGGRGTWEVATTEWGAPYEPTSTEKAAHYALSYQHAVLDQPGRALGGYAFTWGHKVEGTATWFGMLLPDGSTLASADKMQAFWTGEAPTIAAPTISEIRVEETIEGRVFEPGESYVFTIESDDSVAVEWGLYPETGEYLTGGDYRPAPVRVDGAFNETEAATATLTTPEEPGYYRVIAIARGSKGKSATASYPLKVKGEIGSVQFPVYVYEDGFEGMPWAPSGWMGTTDALTLDPHSTRNVKTGDRSLRIRYESKFGWAAVAWQHPANDWGEVEGGFDLTGARKLELWARGEYGGERVKFGVGLIGEDMPFPDSTIAEIKNIELTDQWTRYEIPLRRRDLSQIKTGFVFALEGRSSPVTFYLDQIRYVR